VSWVAAAVDMPRALRSVPRDEYRLPARLLVRQRRRVQPDAPLRAEALAVWAP
jgi:hypothetical protein